MDQMAKPKIATKPGEHETKEYTDGSSAAGPGPLPDQSPEQQESMADKADVDAGEETLAQAMEAIADKDRELQADQSVFSGIDAYLGTLTPSLDPNERDMLARIREAVERSAAPPAAPDLPWEEAPAEAAQARPFDMDRREMTNEAHNAIKRARTALVDMTELMDTGLPAHHPKMAVALGVIEGHLAQYRALITA